MHLRTYRYAKGTVNDHGCAEAAHRHPPNREEFSERLLKGSVKKSYAPIVDIDWDAPLDPDKFFLPPNVVSLYGTPQWDAMTREQQIELSRQELVSILSAGIWFENILNQALLRDLMHKNPTASATHYALTELGDETRHMVMFGKTIARVGGIPVRPRLHQRIVINSLPFAFEGACCGSPPWSARRSSTHCSARSWRIPNCSRSSSGSCGFTSPRRRATSSSPATVCASGADMPWTAGCWWPTCTASADCSSGCCSPCDPVQPRRSRRSRDAPGGAASPHRRGVQVTAFAPLAAFLEEVGLMGPIARRMWRRAGFLHAIDADPFDVVVIGAASARGHQVARAGITNFVILENADEVIGSVFDDAAHTWTLTHARRRKVPRPDGHRRSHRTACEQRQQHDALEPYLGVAMHGVPNQFLLAGQISRASRLRPRVPATDGAYGQHPHRGPAQQPADVQRPHPRQAPGSSASYWRRRARADAVGVRPQLGYRCLRRGLRRSRHRTIGDDEHAVRVRADRPYRSHRRPISLAGNNFRVASRRRSSSHSR